MGGRLAARSRLMRLSVNAQLLFTEAPLLERFDLIAEAGFDAVESWWPEGEDLDAFGDAVLASGLELVLLNFDGGEMADGDRGLLGDLERSDRFRENAPIALELASRLGCSRLNALAGLERRDQPREQQLRVAVANARWAADLAARRGAQVLIEPINRFDNGPYLLDRLDAAIAFIDEVDRPNVRLQFDVYHAARTESESLVSLVERHAPLIAHVQLADAPGRGMPGSGEIDFEAVLSALERAGYSGHLGLECRPHGATAEALAWLPGPLRSGWHDASALSASLVDRSTRYVMLAAMNEPEPAPFDVDLLDALMEEAQLDVLLISSEHSLSHALGGYRFFLYDKLDSVGISRYAPLLGYVRGRIDKAFYVAWGDEGWGLSTATLWVPQCETVAWTAAQAARRAAELIAQRVGTTARVGVEMPFLTADAYAELRQGLPEAHLEDAVLVLDELRAVKRPAELAAMRIGADAVVDAMLAVFADLQAGSSKAEVAERLRQEETRRGLEFDYCLIAAAPDLNRAPSSQRISPGAAVSLDSGAGYRGFVADLARMGVIGAPSTLQQELLGMVDEVQQAARAQVAAGRRGGEMFDAAEERIQAMPSPESFSFVAHGMGRRSHEAPRLNIGKPPYPASHRERALQPGMVISIETHVTHPQAGFVKLEDAVAVTADGCEPLGDEGRGWNRAGG